MCFNCKPRNNCKSIVKEYGYVCYSETRDNKMIVFNLYIYKQYRGQGFAKELLRECIKLIREKIKYDGEILIEVKPTDASIDAIKLRKCYEKLGLTILESEED